MGTPHKKDIPDNGFNKDAGTDSASAGQKGNGIGRLASWPVRSADRMTRLTAWMRPRVSWSKSATECEKRALRILADPEGVTYVSPGRYSVKSQSQAGQCHTVKIDPGGAGWCYCDDHKYRRSQCMHILTTTDLVVDRDALGVLAVESDGRGHAACWGSLPALPGLTQQQPDGPLHLYP